MRNRTAYQLFAGARSVLFRQVDGRPLVLGLDRHVRAGPEQQLQALGLVVDGAIVHRRVAVERGHVQVARVLHEEVDDVQRLAALASDGDVKRRFPHVLNNKKKAHTIKTESFFAMTSVAYAVDEMLSEVGPLDVRLEQLMDVLVVQRVLDVAVQVAHVAARPDGEFLLDVLGPDELAPHLPGKFRNHHDKISTFSSIDCFVFQLTCCCGRWVWQRSAWPP